MPKNETAAAAAAAQIAQMILPVEPGDAVESVSVAVEGDEENGGSDFRVIALIPVEGSDSEYTARLFLNRTDVKKNLKLDNLPEGILFYRGKRLLPKVQTVVTL